MTIRALVLSAAVLALFSPAAVATAADELPATIPAVQTWQPKPAGHYRFRESSRIVVGTPVARGLAGAARLLARDVNRLLGFRPRVVVGGAARAGDVGMALDRRNVRGLGRQGYRLRLGALARIRAGAAAGAFYGTRTLLQLLARTRRLPAGRVRDRPSYPQRGLMVDAGRKYFTPRWFREHVRELSFLKLNLLHLHLSDNEGFRIESESHPEAVSARHLTKRQVRRIVRIASRHHIEVVPEIDMPGHMTAALAAHPELQLENVLGERQPDKLDITNPAARRFAGDLIREYLRLFGGRYWHMGADEYLGIVPIPDGPVPDPLYLLYPRLEAFADSRYGPDADGHDAVDDFIEWVRRIVERHGKTLRMWHDGLELDEPGAVQVDPGVIAEWWLDLTGPPPADLVARGHRVLNGGWFPTYYVQGPLATVRPDMETAYEAWDPTIFQGPLVCSEQAQLSGDTLPAGERRNLGTKLHVWNDDPEAQTEEEIAAAISMRLRVLAQKGWGSAPAVAGYDAFLALADEIGFAPGFNEIPGPPSAADGRDCLS